MNILVTGAAGYVGSHLIKKLLKNSKIKIFGIDNLSNSSKSIINIFQKNYKNKFIFKKIDINNSKKISRIVSENKINVIIHLAAKIDAYESINKENLYKINNYEATKNLIDLAIKNKLKKFIFASSAAVYGDVSNCYCSESNRLNPINPYGKFKYLAENYLKKNQNKLNFTILRFFNIAGINKEFYPFFYKRRSLFFSLFNYLINKQKYFFVNRSLYKTKDNSTVRDYIHINDICRIIYKSIYLKNLETANCGRGKKVSVLQFIDKFRKKFKIKIDIKSKYPRKGDPSCVIANNLVIKKKFKNFEFSSFDLILKDCYAMYLYYKKNRN